VQLSHKFTIFINILSDGGVIHQK